MKLLYKHQWPMHQHLRHEDSSTSGSLLRELTCEVESGGIRVSGGDRAASFEVSPLTPSAPLAPSPFLDRCGSCGDTVDMGKDDMVRCRSCGHRILYKTRLKRAVQYEAR